MEAYTRVDPTRMLEAARQRTRISLRAWVIGIILVLLLGVGIPYSDLVMKGTWVGLTAFPIASFALLFVLVALINPVLRFAHCGLTQGELLTIFAMMLVAAGIPSFGLTGLLIPYIAGPYYFASPENRFDEIILPYLPKWFAPEGKETIKYLYEGLPAGVPAPLMAWVRPLLFWTVLIGGVYLVFFSLSALLRRQWVENEKLVFPLVHLPVQMAAYGDSREVIPAFFRNKTMWAFFALPFVIHSFNGLRYYFPQVPYFNVHRISLDIYFNTRPWNAMLPFWVRIPFSIIGLTYLLPADLAFSLWFFYFFFLAQQVIMQALGKPMRNVQAYPVKEFVAHQMIGGIVLFGAYSLWSAREHLLNALKRAFGKMNTASIMQQQDVSIEQDNTHGQRMAYTLDDAAEPLSFRTAFLGVLIGMVIIVIWGGIAGGGWVATLVLFVLYFLVHIVAVRLVCEGGMLYVQHPFRPWNIMLTAMGSARFGPRRIAILTLFDHLFMLDNRSPLMPCIMQAFKIADMSRLHQRSLAKVLGVSVFIAIISSYISYLWLMYRYGGMTLHSWFTTYYTKNLYCTWTAHLITTGEQQSPTALFTMFIGAATMGIILFMHRTFLGFPFHPIGYLMGASWPMINFWFPIMVGWAVKTVVLRFGGAQLYRQLVPGFLGFIMAEFFSAGLWVVIDFIAGKRGHEIFSF